MAQKLNHAVVGDIRGLQLASFPPSPPPLLDASLGVVLCPDYGTTSTEKKLLVEEGIDIIAVMVDWTQRLVLDHMTHSKVT